MQVVRGSVRFSLAALLLLGVVDAMAGSSSVDGLPDASPKASPIGCPVTQPNGKQPPPGAHVFGRGNGDYGNDALWTSLWIWGEGAVLVPPTHILPDGSFGPLKWAWWRGVPGQLVITGQRLDAPAPPLQAYGAGGVPLHDPPEPSGEFGVVYSPTAFLPTGLVFPTAGCWEITARVGDASLTFVTLVIAPTPTT
jgi:hypothetical protein